MPVRIAVLGDLHGRIFPALEACIRWQEMNKKRLDLIVQTGDFGVWPDPEKLDKATKWHVERGMNELDFSLIKRGGEEADKLFEGLGCPVVFVKGNHEDFQYLDYMAATFGVKGIPVPAEPSEKILYLPNGKMFKFKAHGRSVRIGGLGGVGKFTRPNKYSPSAYIQEHEAEWMVRNSGGKLDILLCHDSPWGAVLPGSGSEVIDKVIGETKPAYVFFSHYGKQPWDSAVKVGEADVYKMDSINSERPMGILEWEKRGESRFHYVEGSWLQRMLKRGESKSKLEGDRYG